jgi:D-3-phosphoglycerate dehydrogenase
MDIPLPAGVHRILNVHKNVPGVLKDINNVLSPYNISAQTVATMGPIGYFMCNLDTDASQEAKNLIASLPSSIKTRVLF